MVRLHWLSAWWKCLVECLVECPVVCLDVPGCAARRATECARHLFAFSADPPASGHTSFAAPAPLYFWPGARLPRCLQPNPACDMAASLHFARQTPPTARLTPLPTFPDSSCCSHRPATTRPTHPNNPRGHSMLPFSIYLCHNDRSHTPIQ